MINNISLKNFRCYKNYSINTSNRLVILSGKNAVGKTSILEAINIASTTKSHRTQDVMDVLYDNEEFSLINIKNDNDNFKIIISKDSKNYFINGIKEAKASSFIGRLKTVMFSPNDIDLICGTKSIRRRFLDLEIGKNDKEYLYNLSKYKKIINERNNVLKNDNLDYKYLSIITSELVESLKIIYKKRIQFIDLINEELKNTSNLLKIKTVSLSYKASYNKDDILKSFKEKEKYDILTKMTNIGCHRDDFDIYYDSKDALTYASEGEKRIIVIAIKLSLAKIIEEKYNIKPIIMLDDVYASLDKDKIEALSNYVMNCGQTFITTTSILEIPDVILKDALVIRIEKEKKDGR